VGKKRRGRVPKKSRGGTGRGEQVTEKKKPSGGKTGKRLPGSTPPRPVKKLGTGGLGEGAERAKIGTFIRNCVTEKPMEKKKKFRNRKTEDSLGKEKSEKKKGSTRFEEVRATGRTNN